MNKPVWPKAMVGMALAYSVVVALALPLGMLGVPFVLSVGYSFGHAVPCLLAGGVALYLDHRFALGGLGLPRPLFISLLMGGLVPLATFLGFLAYYGLGFGVFPT